MILSDTSIKRPVLATVLNIALMTFGLISYFQLPLREYPDIDLPVITIQTFYPGASAEIVEAKITQLIEDRISGIDGIKTINSSSVDGQSNISVEFNLTKNIESAANDIRDRVSKVIDDLPQEVKAPEVSKSDSNEDVILWFSLSSSKRSDLELTDYADRYLVDRLSIVEGVARVRIGGERRYAIRIWLDPQKLAAHNLTTADVEAVLKAENVELPAGRLESQDREFTLRVNRLYQSPEDFRALVLSRKDPTALVRLGDVAHVELGSEDTRSELRGNGQPMIGLGIIKQTQANTLEVGEKVKAEVKKIQESLPPDITINDAYDTTVFVEAAIQEVKRTLFIAIGLVGIIIFLFLGRLSLTLIPMLTIPVSLLSSFIALNAFGFSINILTLIGLILAIGIVVDDSIIVLENNYRRMELGESSLLASYRGTRQIAFAVIVTTFSLVGVFAPIAFLRGISGRLFTELVFSLSTAVLASSFAALTLSPVLSSILPVSQKEQSALPVFINRQIKRLQKIYVHLLTICLRHPVYILTFVAATLGISGGLFLYIPQEYAPREDRGAFYIFSDGPEGASYNYMVRKMALLENKITFLQKNGWSSSLLIRIPRSFSATDIVNTGISIVVLNPWGKRPPADTLIGMTQQAIKDIEGIRSFPAMRQGLQRGGIQQSVQFVIGGGDFKTLAQWRDAVLKKIDGNPYIADIDYDYKETKPKFLLFVNKDKAASLGITALSLSQTLETLFSSEQVTTYFDRGEEYNVILQAQTTARETPKDLEKIYVRSETTGKLVPLINLLDIKETADSATLNRYNRVRSITLSANVAPGHTLGEALDYLDKAARETLPPEAIIDYKGESLDYKESKGANLFVFVMALVAVYLLLAAQFESFIHPFVIMVTVPFAILGALIGLAISGGSLNIFSQIGMVMLIGMSAKNGILIVEFTNQLRDKGYASLQALLRASKIRLRPILMTSFATIMGAVPLLISFGAGAETRISIGVVIFFGIFFTTFFTLFTIPVFYYLIARNTSSPLARERSLETLIKEHSEKI